MDVADPFGAVPSILTKPQTRFFKVFLGLALFVLANSAFLFLAPRVEGGGELTVFYQLMLLGHIGGAVLLILCATVFLFWHLGRVRKLMNARTVGTGAGLAVALYLLLASGLFILTDANSEENRPFFVGHQLLALLAPLAYLLHRVWSHFRPPVSRVLRGVGAVGGLAAAMLVAHVVELPATRAAAVEIAAKDDPFVPFVAISFPDPSSPFAPANTTTDSMAFFPARILTREERGDQQAIADEVEKYGFAPETSIGAETCRRCHADIVEQWEASAHRFSSFNNPFYRASVENVREEAGRKKSQWCASCHDPAIMLAGNMTKEIDPLTPESQAGLTCLACHAIDEIHSTTGNGHFNVADEKPSKYLGDGASSGPGRWLADYLIKAKPARHKALMKKDFFETSEFCSTCHKVSLDVPVNDYKWLRGQNEYDNWHDSGVSHNAARTFYLPPAARNCQECHMPKVPAPLGDVSAKNGLVRSHRFLAVNTALPYIRGDFETLERTEAFMKDDKLTVDVFAVERPDGGRVRALDVAQPTLAAGEEAIFEVVVRNLGVGHTFPGGTNDSNEGWVELTIEDEGGEVLFRSGGLREDEHVDPDAHFYRVVMLGHDGEEARKRDPHNFHVPAFARVIGPGTADVARYGFTIPEELAGRRIRIRARLLWRKFNRQYTEFVFKERGLKVPDLPHLQGQEVPDLPITTFAEDEVVLAVGESFDPGRPVDDGKQWMRYNDHGIASFLQGALDVAEESWREVARLQPERVDGWRNQARRWISSATPERAYQLLRKVDELAPKDPQRPYFWGRYFEEMEEYENAVEAFRASLAVFPADRDAMRRLGNALFKLHRYEESLDAYLEVLEIDPEDLESHKRRLEIYRLVGNEEAAAEAAKAFERYRRDDEGEEVARDFLKRREEINHDAQRRHVHR